MKQRDINILSAIFEQLDVADDETLDASPQSGQLTINWRIQHRSHYAYVGLDPETLEVSKYGLYGEDPELIGRLQDHLTTLTQTIEHTEEAV